MEHVEVKRADTRIFWREALRPRRIVLQLLFWVVAIAGATVSYVSIALIAISLGCHWFFAESAAKKKRFINARFAALWNGCRERFESFEDGIRKLHKAEVAQFEELPKTVEKLAMTIYYALRRADILLEEVSESEGKDRMQAGVPQFHPTDPQAVELYRIAEKNLGEYRSNYNELMAGIQRTEAQATVFITTIDNLRVKMLGYRLIGKNPSMNSEEFLSALAEARTQLSAIDTALEELDLSHYPKTISVVNSESSHPEPLIAPKIEPFAAAFAEQFAEPPVQDAQPISQAPQVPPPLHLGEITPPIDPRSNENHFHNP
jgi:hypothetical protein